MRYVAIVLTVLTVLVFATMITRHLRRVERQRWLDRFANRGRVPFREQIQSRLGMLPAGVAMSWERVSNILEVDPDLLRPDDRLDGILGEDKQFPCDGNFHDLCDELSQYASSQDRIETLWDAVMLMAARNQTCQPL